MKFTPKENVPEKSGAGRPLLALRSLRSTRTTFLVIFCHLENDRAFAVQTSQALPHIDKEASL